MPVQPAEPACAAAAAEVELQSWGAADEILALLAVDPGGLGGVWLKAPHGPVVDGWMQRLRGWAECTGAPVRRLPSAISDERLLGGLDLQATLAAGRPVAQRALLAEVDGGCLVVPMAERLPAGTAARLSATLDTGVVRCEREGLAHTWASRFAVLALDEARDDEPGVVAGLADRLAFWVTPAPRPTPGSTQGNDGGARASAQVLAQARAAGLRSGSPAGEGVGADGAPDVPPPAGLPGGDLADLRKGLATVHLPEPIVEAMCAAADALGVTSVRATLMAVRVARASAVLSGRGTVDEDDARVAVRLVLAPRATRLPAGPDADAEAEAEADLKDVPESPEDPTEGCPEDPPEPAPPAPADAHDGTPPSDPDDADSSPGESSPLDEQLVAAALAALPRGLLDSLGGREHAARAGRVGTATRAPHTGRRLGSRAGLPRHGAALALVDTLRAAAPWQPVRRREAPPAGQAGQGGAGGSAPALRILPSDLRVSRREQRTATATVFVVDASGSSALHRLAEAKGAVNLLLAECYVRRDEVAVIGFRGTQASLLLPPTRSLVRARRELAGLPGGGGTPLASALDATGVLVAQLRRAGSAPLVVLMTDGRANIDRAGAPGRAAAERDALAAAALLRLQQVRCLLVDTSPRASRQALELATALGARYLELPHAQAATLARAVQQAGAPR